MRPVQGVLTNQINLLENELSVWFAQVYFTDMTYEETKEEFAYDIISLLCDIGGTLGLLLGASG